MAGVTSIDVKESLDDLAEKLRHVETPTAKERLQVLYWLKQDNAPSISAIAKTKPHANVYAMPKQEASALGQK